MRATLARGVAVLLAGAAVLAAATCKKAAPPPAEGGGAAAPNVKAAVAAGRFYPGDADELRRAVRGYLDAATPEGAPAGVVAVFTPHAGYEYSGLIAAAAYCQLGDRKPDTFVILAPSHHYGPEAGIAAPTYDGFATPLGTVPVDRALVEAVTAACPAVSAADAPFEAEHAVEVQLPFIQVLAPGAAVAPFVFCRQDEEAATAFGHALAKAIRERGGDVVIVCTCDLSHYHPYDEARALDGEFVRTFKTFDAAAVTAAVAAARTEIDAPGPVVAAFTAARDLGAEKTLVLAQRNSGDVTGDASAGVVGYFAGAAVK